MEDVKREAQRCGIELIIRPTAQAVEILDKAQAQTNSILHTTC
jgi:hypothetical protein